MNIDPKENSMAMLDEQTLHEIEDLIQDQQAIPLVNALSRVPANQREAAVAFAISMYWQHYDFDIERCLMLADIMRKYHAEAFAIGAMSSTDAKA